MKFYFVFILISLVKIKTLKIAKNKRSSSTSCEINSIEIKEGSTNPIMIYKATSNGNIYRIMAVPEELNQKYQNFRKSSNILLEDKQTKFYFYSEQNNNNSENFRKLASTCKSLNKEIINQKEYQQNGKFANLRINNNLIF